MIADLTSGAARVIAATWDKGHTEPPLAALAIGAAAVIKAAGDTLADLADEPERTVLIPCTAHRARDTGTSEATLIASTVRVNSTPLRRELTLATLTDLSAWALYIILTALIWDAERELTNKRPRTVLITLTDRRRRELTGPRDAGIERWAVPIVLTAARIITDPLDTARAGDKAVPIVEAEERRDTAARGAVEACVTVARVAAADRETFALIAALIRLAVSIREAVWTGPTDLSLPITELVISAVAVVEAEIERAAEVPETDRVWWTVAHAATLNIINTALIEWVTDLAEVGAVLISIAATGLDTAPIHARVPRWAVTVHSALSCEDTDPLLAALSRGTRETHIAVHIRDTE